MVHIRSSPSLVASNIIRYVYVKVNVTFESKKIEAYVSMAYAHV